MVTRKLTLFLLPVFLFLFFSIGRSEEYSQSPSLSGVTTAKVYFDVNMGIPEKLLVRLVLIDKTLTQLQAAGVKPEAVIGFRGKASKFVTKGDFYVEKEEQAVKAEIHKWLKRFADEGIPMEQCLIAAELHGIAPNDFRPEVKVIQNGYVSMIAYQNKGFAQIPMD